jgi:hypothetical protein
MADFGGQLEENREWDISALSGAPTAKQRPHPSLPPIPLLATHTAAHNYSHDIHGVCRGGFVQARFLDGDLLQQRRCGTSRWNLVTLGKVVPRCRGPHSHRWPLTGHVCTHRPRSGRTGCGTCCGGIRTGPFLRTVLAGAALCWHDWSRVGRRMPSGHLKGCSRS